MHWRPLPPSQNRRILRETAVKKTRTTAFIGGHFAASEIIWTKYEEEDFEMVLVFDKLDYALWCRMEVLIFTDQRILFYFFVQVVLWPNSSGYVISEVYWWAMHLSLFDFSIEYIYGVKNVFKDLFTNRNKGNSRNYSTGRRILVLYNSVVPSSDEMTRLCKENG